MSDIAQTPKPGKRSLRFFPLIEPALDAFKTYWPAILLIQLIALSVVLVFYFVDGAESVFAKIAAFKANGGLLFAAVATVISSGVFPEFLKRLFRPKGVAAPTQGELVHQFIMWAAVGIAVDSFYTLQAKIFGTGTDPLTLLIKVAVDQLVFTPTNIAIVIVNWYLIRETGYSFRRWKAKASPRLFIQRVLPIWATALSFWPVMLLIIYSLPSLLQFPLFLFANGAFSILMIFIARRQSGSAAE